MFWCPCKWDFLFFSFFFIDWPLQLVRSEFSDHEPGPQQWWRRVLTTGPPGKSQAGLFFSLGLCKFAAHTEKRHWIHAVCFSPGGLTGVLTACLQGFLRFPSCSLWVVVVSHSPPNTMPSVLIFCHLTDCGVRSQCWAEVGPCSQSWETRPISTSAEGLHGHLRWSPGLSFLVPAGAGWEFLSFCQRSII